MVNVENLLNDNLDDFRKEVHNELFGKIKEKLENKKIEIAASLYDDQIPENEECEECGYEDASAPEQPD